MIKIRKAEKGEEKIIATIISKANSLVLKSLNIDISEWSRHPSNCREEIIHSAVSKGEKIFVAAVGNNIIGTISLKKIGNSFELKRLSVLPQYQRSGTGSKLLEFARAYARDYNGTSIRLGAIEDNNKLISWYIKHGFIPKKSKRFKGIPVRILFMELTL